MYLKDKKVFITGGTGFIGQHLVKLLLKNDVEIVNFAKQASNIKQPRYKTVKGDICDPSSVDKAMEGCDVVINLAAETSARRSMTHSREFMHTNYIGVYVLLESARRFGIKKFFQMSTDQVYGNNEGTPFSEDAVLNPTNPYAASKAAADLLALSYFKTYTFPVIIARSSIVFGPHQRPVKLLPLYITNALHDKPLPVFNDGQEIRQWIFVEDLCTAVLILLENGKAGEIYNIGGPEYTNLEIAEQVLKLLGKSSLISHVRDDKFYDRRYSTSTSKIKKLGWKPKYKFEDALSKTADWYKKEISQFK